MSGNEEKASRYWPYILFIGAITLYLQSAWLPSFFADGYLYAAFGKNAAEKGHWLIPHLSKSTYNEFSQHIPFVFILEGIFFKIFSANYITARVFASLASLLTLFFLFRSSKKYLGDSSEYLAGIIFILIPPLMKKTRFPNLDIYLMLFIFLSALFLYRGVIENKLKNWLAAGLAFGLALLCKGPAAVFLLVGFILYLVLSKRLEVLKRTGPWIGLSLSVFIFSIWPLALYMVGRGDIFDGYLTHTFSFTIQGGRGQETLNPFVYIWFCIKNFAPWFVLALSSLYLWIKHKNISEFSKYCLLIFLGFLIPLSFMKFKYSHYLIPLYPFLAVSAAETLGRWKWKARFIQTILCIFAVLPLVFAILPLTNKVKRDREIYEVSLLIPSKRYHESNWLIVDSVYPFFSLANKIGFESGKDVLSSGCSNLNNLFGNDEARLESEGSTFTVNEGEWIILAPKNCLINAHLVKVAEFSGKNMAVYLKGPKVDKAEHVYQGH